MGRFETRPLLFFLRLTGHLLGWVFNVLGNFSSVVTLLQLGGGEEWLVVLHKRRTSCLLWLLRDRDVFTKNILGLIEGLSSADSLGEGFFLELARILEVLSALQLFGAIVVVLNVGDLFAKLCEFARFALFHGIC